MRLLCVEHKIVWGGGQVALTSLLREWQRTGVAIQPLVVCPHDAQLAPRTRASGIQTETYSLGAIEKTRGIAWNLAQRVRPTIQLVETMRRSRTELILANGAFSFLASVFAAKLARVPIVWWEHNTTLPGDGPVQRMLGWANRIVVVSEAIRQQFVKLAPDAAAKIVVVYNGVDTEKFSPNRMLRQSVLRGLGWDTNVQVVGTVSRLSSEKGIGYFVDAANELVPQNPNARFLIVGEGPERAELERRAKSNALRFVGMREDVPNWLNALDLFVLPSLAESFGLAVVEAMACGVPVVTLDVGGLREVVVQGETGLRLPPQEVDAIASAILELLRNADKRRVMGEKGRTRAIERFDLKRQAAEWERVIFSVQL